MLHRTHLVRMLLDLSVGVDTISTDDAGASGLHDCLLLEEAVQSFHLREGRLCGIECLHNLGPGLVVQQCKAGEGCLWLGNGGTDQTLHSKYMWHQSLQGLLHEWFGQRSLV